MYLMIDNLDSFVYNLVAYFKELGAEILVYKNNEITVKECMEMKNLETTAKNALGDKFNYKDYHTVILNAGSCNYDYLKKQVNNYIKANN